MESAAIMPLSVRPLPRSILDLPTEVRLRIYEFLYDEISIHCANSRVNPTSHSPSRVSPSAALLFTCRKIHNEAKPYIDKAPIAVTVDENGIVNSRLFPPHVLRRVHTLSHVGTFIFPTSALLSVFGFNFFDKDICPTLWLIRKLPYSNYANVRYPSNRGLLPIILPLLRKPQSNDTPPVPGSSPNLFTAFQTQARAYGYGISVDNVRTFLIRNNLTLKAPYKFGMRMLDHGAIMTQLRAPKILMEQWFTVEVIWDGHIFLIEGLPDFREQAWWKDPTGWTSYTRSYDGLRHLEIIVCDVPSHYQSGREWQCWYGKSW